MGFAPLLVTCFFFTLVRNPSLCACERCEFDELYAAFFNFDLADVIYSKKCMINIVNKFSMWHNNIKTKLCQKNELAALSQPETFQVTKFVKAPSMPVELNHLSA